MGPPQTDTTGRRGVVEFMDFREEVGAGTEILSTTGKCPHSNGLVYGLGHFFIVFSCRAIIDLL